tara:strand:- start:99 stop:431 length:333 start_codon:yes stop_codon:yes gene_type:complete
MKFLKIISFLYFCFIAFNVEAKIIECTYIDNPIEKHKIKIDNNIALELTPFGKKISYKFVALKESIYTLKNSEGAINQKRSWLINQNKQIGKLKITENNGESFLYNYICK